MKQFTYSLSDDNSIYVDCLLQEEHAGTLSTPSKRPAVIICPGGGYRFWFEHEGKPVALKYAAAGFHTFVLHYHIGTHVPFPTSLIDLGKTIKALREHAEEWGILPDKIAVCGFSAGGHLAASLGVYWNDPDILAACQATQQDLRPNLLILAYPLISTSWLENNGIYGRIAGDTKDPALYKKINVHTAVSADTPPTFLTHGAVDIGVPVRDPMNFAMALDAHGVPFEMHIYSHASHSYSTADTTSVPDDQADETIATWVPLSIAWLNRNFSGSEPKKDFKKPPYTARW